MPGPDHEVASWEFGYLIKKKAAGMGLEAALGLMGATTYQGTTSRKQADCSLKPWLSRPHRTDFPTVVIECGVSESYNRLVNDSRWWLENSQGHVKVVLLLKVSVAMTRIRLGQWEMVTTPNPRVTQRHPGPTRTRPTMASRVDILPAVAPAPFTLEFRNIFLRLPRLARGESNFVFTQQDLQSYATLVWNCVQ
ncbi:hypothetical protein L873DRAFT_308482 [Choiromyces venosus 120613-1]|uniref:Uncharacterized protein n=1 Tax=Choiromyces venosus 120613-1 TaxID=1336337 RepID=A0A3N4IZ68_9PEZI|nr:hypothetical protein L873DRAFT_308482 [Choiromyces venosus 120613-1]